MIFSLNVYCDHYQLGCKWKGQLKKLEVCHVKPFNVFIRQWKALLPLPHTLCAGAIDTCEAHCLPNRFLLEGRNFSLAVEARVRTWWPDRLARIPEPLSMTRLEVFPVHPPLRMGWIVGLPPSTPSIKFVHSVQLAEGTHRQSIVFWPRTQENQFNQRLMPDRSV